MSAKKIIIRNCPCYWHFGKAKGCSLDDMKHCEDDTDCVWKQIVESLQQYDEENSNWCEPIPFNTENIYELLDIQEVE